MKSRRIVLFIFGVIALLALVCIVFPSDGIKLGPATLRFPSLSEVLGAADSLDEVVPLSPEEIESQRLARLAAAREDELEHYLRTDSCRIYMPGGNLDYLDGLFEAFDSAAVRHVRVVHCGDSQLEEDRMTGVLRDSLQSKFGGGGVGLLPAKRYFTFKISETASAEMPEYGIYPEMLRKSGGKYGPLTRMSRLDGGVSLSFTPTKKNDSASRYFDRLTVYAGDIAGNLSASVKGQSQSVTQEGALSRIVFDLPDSTEKVSLSLSGHADILGVSLDKSTGVSVDNVPMRGCSGTIFTYLSANQLREYYRRSDTRLIILQYGGNSVPAIRTPAGISDYCQSMNRQIELLQDLAPQAAIIFIGPSDMSTSAHRTYAMLPQMVDSLRANVNALGAAYWDLYAAMGGKESMPRWVKSGLAGPDYIHFTNKGSEKMGAAFADALLLSYEYYKLRKNK